MKLSEHPVWLAGFRPFFILACLSGLSLPLLWILILFGYLPGPMVDISPIQWHAHEMFYGFGWSVIGGFLLTATKNWVKIRGYHGSALILLTCAWLAERLALWHQAALPAWLFLLLGNLFLVSIVLMLLHSLIRYRQNDAFADNYFFLIALPLFLVAKNLLLSPDFFQTGIVMTTGLIRLAFLVMLERTTTQFMKNAAGVDILRNPSLDTIIKALGLLMVFAGFLPALAGALLSGGLALLLLVRFTFWKPLTALRRIDLGVMYLGYLAIVGQLALYALSTCPEFAWITSISTHLFALGAMGLVIPAMIVRIAKGHTGRKPGFDKGDKWVLYIMIAGLAARVAGPLLAPQGYTVWLFVAAACWLSGFGLLAWRYVPMLMRARIDGKAH